MDASQSNDPFRGEGHGEIADAAALAPQEEETPVVPEFNEDRWRRAGATDDQITALQTQWDGYTDDEKTAADAWMHQTSDEDLMAWLNQGQSTPAEPVQTGDPNAQPTVSSENPDAAAAERAAQDASGNLTPDQRAQLDATPIETAPPPADGVVTDPGVLTEPPTDETAGAAAPAEDADVAPGNADDTATADAANTADAAATTAEAEAPDGAVTDGQMPVAGPTGTNVENVPEGNAAVVEAWVGDNKDRARAALEKENNGEQRKGLTAHLEKLLSA